MPRPMKIKPRTEVHGFPSSMLTTVQKAVEETAGGAQAEMFLSPLHLLYMVTIHTGDFDVYLRKGMYADNVMFYPRMMELIHGMELVHYDGQHHLTQKGKDHLAYLLKKAVL